MKSRLVRREKLPIYIVGILLVLASFFAFQQEAIAAITGKIAGVVKDAETGEALPGANIIIVGTTMGAAADVDGYYYMINIPPGTYSVQARMMGYESVTKTGVIVSVDHTTPVDFELRPTAVEVPGITVMAKKEVIKMDLSSSSIVAEEEEITAVPLVKDIQDYVNLQAGIEGWGMRGGGREQTKFMIDGLLLVDNRANEPIMSPNLSTIKELNVLKGGFNAEYGNVRSGVINVITQEGSRRAYHGSVDFRWTPAHQKHRGPSLFDPDNYYLRPYLDDEVCWLGTDVWLEKGTPEDSALWERYPHFQGWNTLAEGKPGTPEDYRNEFIWEHRLEGANAIAAAAGYTIPSGMPREASYGDKPDLMVDAGFGGPIPGLGDKLTFFASYRTNKEAFALPTSRDYYQEENTQLRLTYYIFPGMKLGITGLYGTVNTVARSVWAGTRNDYLRSGSDILWSSITSRGSGDRNYGASYLPSALTPYDIKRSMVGVTFEHALSSNTFYSLRLTRSYIENLSDTSFIPWRDTTPITLIGGVVPVDEKPYGLFGENIATRADGMNIGGIQSSQRDYSNVTTINIKADLTSQINTHNQIKLGAEFNSDDDHTIVGSEELYTVTVGWMDDWDASPTLVSAYIQDKVEYEGMIANIGVRADYFNPKTEWYTGDPYSKYFSKTYKHLLKEECPTEPTEDQLKISPRFGISHPISENARIFFNYGHFYSLARTRDLYGIGMGNPISPLTFLGNPSAEMPKTVAYELGYEHQIADYLLHVAGYYKNVTDQTGDISYIGYDEVVDYNTTANNNYEDIRGFEVSLRKRFGRWITGWINYDYRVLSYGYTGRQYYYQDRRMQATSGLYEIVKEQEDVRPVLRAQVTLKTPEDFGPVMGGWNLSLLYSWREGALFSWDPLRLATPEVINNVRWKPYYMIDARLSKNVELGGNSIELYVNVNNLFDIKRLSYGSRGFVDLGFEDYMKSLHLPMYDDPRYGAYEGGNDQPGDVKSKDKEYIDMPNREFLTYPNLRTIIFGLGFNF